MGFSILNFAKRYLIFVLAAAVIAAGSGAFILLIRPRIALRAEAREKLAQAREVYNGAYARVGVIGEFSKELQSVPDSSIALLRALFVWPPPMAAIASALNTRATASRFLLTAVEISEESARGGKQGPLRTVSVNVRMNGGGYRELKEVIGRITRATPLLDLDSFTFDSRSLALTLNLKAYRAAELSDKPSAIDARFFEDPRFKSLGAPPATPAPGRTSRANPFAPFEEAGQEPSLAE